MAPARFELEFEEEFAGDRLDEGRWLPYYLPHWTTWERAAARCAVENGRLRLMITADQPAWFPEREGGLKVSSLQTGLVAGAPGTTLGQMPYRPPATVRNGPHDIRLYTPHHGRFEVRAAANPDPRAMVAFWLIGLGDAPERTAEICVMEIFGKDVGPGAAAVGMGVHPHGDPRVVEAFEQVRLPIDATEFHDYAAEWRPEQIDFFVDGGLVKTVEQAIDEPMQLMLGIYEFPAEPGAELEGNEEQYPKSFVVDYVRGYRIHR